VRWSVYILFALIACAFDASVGSILEIGSIRGCVLPSVVVFMALQAPRKLVVRAAMLAGLAADLFSPLILPEGGTLVVLGPNLLGFALGGLVVAPLRALLSRQNPLSAPVATLSFSLFAGLATGAVWVLRSAIWGSVPPWWPESGGHEALRVLLGAIGDAAVALPALWLLGKSRPLWGFLTTTKVSPGIARQSA
jgi:hypothetical protein